MLACVYVFMWAMCIRLKRKCPKETIMWEKCSSFSFRNRNSVTNNIHANFHIFIWWKKIILIQNHGLVHEFSWIYSLFCEGGSRERERERERGKGREIERGRESECVCVRERERERENTHIQKEQNTFLIKEQNHYKKLKTKKYFKKM